MTISDIITKITAATGADTSSSGYPSAERLIDINAAQLQVQTMILDSQDESDFDDISNTTYPIKYLSLVAAQRDYSIPQTDKIIGIKRVDVTYDNVTWYRAEPIDSGEIEGGLGLPGSSTQETTTDSQYSTICPRYDYKYGSIWIYPRATAAQVTAGAQMKYEGQREMTDFTSGDVSTGTKVPAIDSAFHNFLWLIPSFNFCTANNLPQAPKLEKMMVTLEARLRRHYGRKQLDRIMDIVPDIHYGSYK